MDKERSLRQASCTCSGRGAKACNGALGSGGSEAQKRTTISHQKERQRMGMATKVANKIAKNNERIIVGGRKRGEGEESERGRGREGERERGR